MRKAFSLIELLVVIAIIALLVGVLLPALGSARRSSKAVACQANLRGIGQGFTLYSGDHREAVIPSYNMTGTAGGADVPLDGWAPILDRDGYMSGTQSKFSNPFYCTETLDVAGVASGQTGTDPNNPKGWLDWPFARTGTGNIAQPIESRGFDRIIRVSYWINADNPIGAAVAFVPNTFYTSSVGYGPPAGPIMQATKLAAFLRPTQLITVADGVYAGRQRDNQIGITNSRIGYRHGGRQGGAGGAANAAFVDGHVATLAGKEFPRALGGSNVPAEVRAENSAGRPTVYANPERTLGQ